MEEKKETLTRIFFPQVLFYKDGQYNYLEKWNLSIIDLHVPLILYGRIIYGSNLPL